MMSSVTFQTKSDMAAPMDQTDYERWKAFLMEKEERERLPMASRTVDDGKDFISFIGQQEVLHRWSEPVDPNRLPDLMAPDDAPEWVRNSVDHLFDEEHDAVYGGQ